MRVHAIVPLLIAAAVASFATLPRAWSSPAACLATVAAKVELARGKFSLADLLGADSCPALRRAAARVSMGSAPLAGSVRVLSGDDVRAVLERLARATEDKGIDNRPGSGSIPLQVPERITVRRAGARASCADIGAQVLTPLQTRAPASGESGQPNAALPNSGSVSLRETECGMGDRIPRATPLELTKTVWDPALASWEVSTRCINRGDCVPFLVRLPEPGSRWVGGSTRENAGPGTPLAANSAAGTPLVRVRPGAKVTLLWEQDGIRLVVPAVCLDTGGTGQRVRVRIEPSGRVLRAIVVSAGLLRAGW